MNCKDANELMDAWIDEELPLEKKAVFEHHLTGCGTCSAKAQELHRLTLLLETQPPALPRSGLKKKTLYLFIKEAKIRGLICWWAGLGWGIQTATAASVLIGLGIGCHLGDGWVGIQQLTQFNISGFLFSAGELLLSWT